MEEKTVGPRELYTVAASAIGVAVGVAFILVMLVKDNFEGDFQGLWTIWEKIDNRLSIVETRITLAHPHLVDPCKED